MASVLDDLKLQRQLCVAKIHSCIKRVNSQMGSNRTRGVRDNRDTMRTLLGRFESLHVQVMAKEKTSTELLSVHEVRVVNA